MDPGPWPCATLRLGKYIHSWHRLLRDSKVAKAEAICSVGRLGMLGTVDGGRDHPMAVQHRSLALAYFYAAVSWAGTLRLPFVLSRCPGSPPGGRRDEISGAVDFCRDRGDRRAVGFSSAQSGGLDTTGS